MLTVFVNEMQKQDWNKTGTKQGKVTTKTTNGNKKKGDMQTFSASCLDKVLWKQKCSCVWNNEEIIGKALWKWWNGTYKSARPAGVVSRTTGVNVKSKSHRNFTFDILTQKPYLH